jgi:hypothetical protein
MALNNLVLTAEFNFFRDKILTRLRGLPRSDPLCRISIKSSISFSAASMVLDLSGVMIFAL